MKIAIASLQQESNSLCPIPSHEEEFDRARGAPMLEKLCITEVLEEHPEVEIIPTLYAHALPGGPLAKEDFLRMANTIIDGIPTNIDGVWLYLHGALFVQGIGSGETWLLRRIREKIGFNVPIALGLDFHANNTDELMGLCNIVCGFRTAPHVDQPETQRKALRLLIHCIQRGLLPKPQLARADVIAPGDCVQTSLPPLASIMARADEMEKQPGVLCAQVFGGQPWVDTPYTGPSMVVTHESDTALAKAMAQELARMFYDARHEFLFRVEALEPLRAIGQALRPQPGPVFLADSGDNPTAGSTGDNAFLLNCLLRAGAEGVLLAGITDAPACAACYAASIGDTLTLAVGGTLSEKSERIVVKARLLHRGDVLGYTGGNAGPSATLHSGGVTFVVTQNRAAFTSLAIFASIGIHVAEFQTVVLKQGYLFPDFAAMAKRSILALTPGCSTERLQDMGHTQIRRPMYPLDDDFL